MTPARRLSGSILADGHYTMRQQPPRLRLGSYGGALTAIPEISSDEPQPTSMNDETMTSSQNEHCYRRSSSMPMQSLEQDEEDKTSEEDEPLSRQLSSSEPDLLHRATSSVRKHTQSRQQQQDEKKTRLFSWKRPRSFTPRSNSATEDKVRQDNMFNQCNAPSDEKGRCIRHPHIRLRKRKKKIFGSSSECWKILHNSCPACCIESFIENDNIHVLSKGMISGST